MLNQREEKSVNNLFKSILIVYLEQHIYHRTGNMPITDQNTSIFNFDLNAAAQAAAIAAANVNSSNRPNYGALAATDSNAQVRRASNMDLNLIGNNVYNNNKDYNQSRQYIDYTHFNNEISHLDMLKQQQDMSLFDVNVPRGASPNNNVFFGYDSAHQNNSNEVISLSLMRSTSEGQNNGKYFLNKS